MIAAAAAAAVMALPGTASAAICGDDGTTELFDSQGYFFDFTDGGATADRNQPFAALYDSGSNGLADTPPGPVVNSDSYDDFGALFVGGTATGNLYFSADNDSCSNPAAGQHDYPVVTINGLQVQRKIFVSPSGPLPGARILNLIGNPGGSPVTTTVQVGDLLSGDNEGDLGSDGDTAVVASSNGDTVASPADFWAVTNDNPLATSDNTLAHIIDGQGGAVKANLFQVGGGTDGTPADNVVWGWTVTIPAGQTIGLMSFEVQQGSVGLSSPTDVASAVAQANTHENAPLSTLYQGMSESEQASVVNWNASNAFTAKLKGRKLIVSVSAPGTVAVSDARAKQAKLSAQSAKKKKRRLGLKPSSGSGGPPQVTVKLKLTKSAKQKLRRTGKVKVKAKITFTPNRGFASTQTKKLKIKSKRKSKSKKRK
jgi:hypothetical protein